MAVHARYARLNTPIGPILVAEAGDELVAVHFENGRRRRRVDPAWRLVDAGELRAAAQLTEYFAGARTAFQVRFAAQGTPFQRRVWAAVAAIPFGERPARLQRNTGSTRARPSMPSPNPAQTKFTVTSSNSCGMES